MTQHTASRPYSDLRLGLFVHYVYSAPGRELTVAVDGSLPGSLDELAEGFDAEGLARAATDMRAEYVIFTAWHACMNALYPSAVMERFRPGHSAKRDVIADLLRALSARGIALMLYVHPTDGHDFAAEDQAQIGWNEGPAYARWNNFVDAVFEELGARYSGQLLGYWFDGGLSDQVRESVDRFRNTLRRVDPRAVTVQNEGFGPDRWFRRWADYGCQECREGMVDPYKATDLQMALLITDEWWARHGTLILTPEVAYRYAVLQASVHNAEGGGVAYSTGPYMRGGWEPGVERFFRQLGHYMDASAGSVLGTRASRSFVTMPGVPLHFALDKWPGGCIAVATESMDGARTFVHVLVAPRNRPSVRLQAPADGRLFRQARLLVGGAPVTLAQDASGVTLTVPAWQPLDTVIELQ